jgi:hypothetical protein
MFYKPLLYPLLAQVLLTFIVMVRMYARRIPEFQIRNIDPEAVKTRRDAGELLVDSASSADNFSNLFEMPVLFYTAVLLALTSMLSDPVLVALAWMYVILRYVHSVIHTTYNSVRHRFYAFIASAVVLLAIWVRLGTLIVLS